MQSYRTLMAIAALSMLGAAGCHGDFLTGGDLTNDPNNPTSATKSQLFQGTETVLWQFLGSDMPRVTGIIAQQFRGGQNQYATLNDAYTVDENTTNGAQTSLYLSGGLVDIVKLQKAAIAANDKLYLGISQVQEGLLMGTGADLFGDLVYSEALNPSIANPKLDDQLTVYDSVQKVLSAAVTNIAAGGIGPKDADLIYGGDPASWSTLAHTLKARFYMHTGEVRPAAYAQALAEAKQGIRSDAGNYFGAFTGAGGEQNFYYQFNFVASRQGYLVPNEFFDKLLERRGDPRRTDYFQIDAKGDTATQISSTRLAPNYQQPFVTYDENTLIWAEAAYRTGDEATALAKLNEERTHNGLPAESGLSGRPLLNEILTEKYISDFQLGIEAWNDYKRTCTPNLVPAPGATNSVTAGKIPRRLPYDANELNTDTQFTAFGVGANDFVRNKNDPANPISDGTGAKCLGQ